MSTNGLHHRNQGSRSASTLVSPSFKESRPLQQNGHHDHDADADGESSEAETVVLSKDDDSMDKKYIKTEQTDHDSDTARLLKQQSRSHSPQPNGHGRNGKVIKLNGAKAPAPERDAHKSPSTSSSSHTKAASPTSPAQGGRGRSVSIIENRKRKTRDGSLPRSIEPPRQKARIESSMMSPATPGFARQHKRSQSTQSAITGAIGRKRRDIPSEAKNWSDSSSDRSASPGPATGTSSRMKRRAPISPARTMPGRKTDRFGATQLALKAEKGDLEGVKEALEDATDELDMVDYAGIAPLQKAALHGWVNVVAFLISKGCFAGCESENRDTPLIDAVENGHLEVVRLLLNEARVNPHHQNKKGQRAIDVLDYEDEDAEAIEKELREAMKRDVDMTAADKPGRKQAKTASRLLYNEYNVETLIEKAGDGDISAVGELINSNIKPNIACGVAAARGGYYDILSVLLASGLKADPDPSKHPETPMTVAIGRGHLNIIELLLRQDNFDPTRRNKDGKTYWETSEERSGPKWEQERDILLRAYEEHKGTHKSPRKVKKEAPNPSIIRMKRKSSPRRDRSFSPRPDAKRLQSTKSVTTTPSTTQKSRRLLSGKEKATREDQRRKRVVDDDLSEDVSEQEVRPPTRQPKPRSYSEGDDGKPSTKVLKTRSEDSENNKSKRVKSEDSDEDQGSVRLKIKKKIVKAVSAKVTPDIDSPDERKAPRNKIKYKTMDEKTRKRKQSDASADENTAKQTPTVSTKSTPAPPDRTATPEVDIKRRLIEVKAEAKRKEAACEIEAKKKEKEKEKEREEREKEREEREKEREEREKEREEKEKEREQREREREEREREEREKEKKEREKKEEEEREKEKEKQRQAEKEKEEAEAVRRKAEQDALRKAEADAEAEAAAKAEKQRLAEAEVAEAIRKQEEEAQRLAEQESARQEMLAARQDRLARLPKALRRACEVGDQRPLHFSGEETGVSLVFLPLLHAIAQDLNHPDALPNKTYICSLQAVGILGLAELDLAHLDAPYTTWPRIPVTCQQREVFLRHYDIAMLAQDFLFPSEGMPNFDFGENCRRIKEAKDQVRAMEGLYWIEDSLLFAEVEKSDFLRPLLAEMKQQTQTLRFRMSDLAGREVVKKPKSLMDIVRERNAAKVEGGKMGVGNG